MEIDVYFLPRVYEYAIWLKRIPLSRRFSHAEAPLSILQYHSYFPSLHPNSTTVTKKTPQKTKQKKQTNTQGHTSSESCCTPANLCTFPLQPPSFHLPPPPSALMALSVHLKRFTRSGFKCCVAQKYLNSGTFFLCVCVWCFFCGNRWSRVLLNERDGGGECRLDAWSGAAKPCWVRVEKVVDDASKRERERESNMVYRLCPARLSRHFPPLAGFYSPFTNVSIEEDFFLNL